MGDRALIQLVNSAGNVSPVIYLHDDGERVARFLRELAALMESRGEDLDYAAARLVGICHTHRPGNLSLGIFNHPARLTKEDSHGDAGCFVVNCKTWEVETMGGYGFAYDVKNYNKEPWLYKKLPEHGVAVAEYDGALIYVPLNTAGNLERNSDGLLDWTEAEAGNGTPEGDERYLAAANAALGTNFQIINGAIVLAN